MEKHVCHKPPELQAPHGIIRNLAEVEKEFPIPAQRKQNGKLRNENSDINENNSPDDRRQIPPKKPPDVRKSIPRHFSTRYVSFQLLEIYLFQKREFNKKRQQMEYNKV